MSSVVTSLAYIIASLCFIFGLKMLSSPTTARRGNLVSAIGMLIAIVVTLLNKNIITFEEILIGAAVGAIVGILAARLVAMTQMPQMVALFNGFGGIASLLVGVAVYILTPTMVPLDRTTIFLSILIGGVTFSGSLIAWAKLSGIISGRPIAFRGQRLFNICLLLVIMVGGVLFVANRLPEISAVQFLLIVAGAALLFGVTFVLPIGGADMPVVISLLNSYSGMAACAAGFVVNNQVMIVAGALVGASGIILTNIMCKAMNRSLLNVLFSGFGATGGKQVAAAEGEVRPINVEDAYYILEAASSVVFVPGYGMAVAQAQHAVRELGEILEANGADVKFAIHPVAGRMPGHMNVLLAEANVSYDLLVEPQDINPIMESVDVAIVIGANDVVNPAAKEDQSSPIYGMPVIEADRAKTVFVLKRSMATGFAGIPNPLFYKENTRMLFGDGKSTVNGLIAEFKES